MKKILTPVLIGVAGLAVGGGAAYATALLMGPPAEETPKAETRFISAGKILAPLVLEDGQLSGYVSFEVSLEVSVEEGADIEAKLPLLLHAINMRSYRTPLAAGPDGMLPEIGKFRKLVQQAATEAFGPGAVSRVAVTQAAPA